MVEPLHVAVLMGGWSSERRVSLVSGAACAEALRSGGFRVTEIDMERPDLAALLAALTPAPHHPEIPQQPELLGHRGLGHLHRLHQLVHAALAVLERGQQPQAVGIRQGAEELGQGLRLVTHQHMHI